MNLVSAVVANYCEEVSRRSSLQASPHSGCAVEKVFLVNFMHILVEKIDLNLLTSLWFVFARFNLT